MISDARMEKALTYLAETDEKAASLLSVSERYEFKARAIKDAMFMHLDGTVAERAAAAGSHAEYLAAMDCYFHALRDFHAVKNKRQTESLIVDVWRSLSANRRQGQV